MEIRTKVLGIAPYESMRDLQQGVELAKRNYYNDYDVILSRGGTAALLREKLSLPVAEIPVTVLDVMRAIKLAENLSNRYAVVGFPNVTAGAQQLARIMQYKIDTFPIQNAQEARQALEALRCQGDRTILCDAVAHTTALEMGMGVLLITSGAESLRAAFEEAVQLCASYRALRTENLFLRDLLWNQVGETVVFDREGKILLSTLEEEESPLIAFLRRESAGLPAGREQYRSKQIRQSQYSIRMTHRTLDRMEYVACYFSESRAPVAEQQKGIRFLDSAQALSAYHTSLAGIAGLPRFVPQLSQAAQAPDPLLLWGEQGTCKEQAVNWIYSQSRLKDHPLAILDCGRLSDKTWNYLLDSCGSPLTQSRHTLFFKNLDLLAEERRRTLLDVVKETDVCRRNRLIFSCTCQGQSLGAAGSQAVEKLGCVPLYLPPLRSQAAELPAIINIYLSCLNTELSRQITGFEAQAMERMQGYGWPGNYTQLQRVIREAVLLSDTPRVTTARIEALLTREKASVPVENPDAFQEKPLDLNQTLEKINREILRRVLEQEGGNQSSTARRLGISRTTLWRMLNSET